MSSFNEIHPFPRSVRWLKTVLWKGLVSPLNLRVGEHTNSAATVVNGINSTLTFVLTRTYPEILTLSCIRNVTGAEILDDDCYIKLYISLYNFNERARPGIISIQQNTIDLEYNMQLFRHLQCRNCETLMKCVIRFVEMENKSNLHHVRQEVQLIRMTEEVFASTDDLTKMAYVLRRPYFGDVYTGRMDSLSAACMSSFIANACQYSRYIYEYIRASDRSDDIMPNIPLTDILSSICETEFNVHVCITLFTVAHRLGLEFLRVLCSAYLIENLSDDSILNTIVSADWTEDTVLFQAAAEYFIGRHWIITSSAEWSQKVQHDEVRYRSLLQSLHFRSTTDDWSFPPLPEEEVEE